MTTNKFKTRKVFKVLKFRSRDFFEKFNTKKTNNFRSLGYRRTERVITYKIYSKIIKRFLSIYFNEVFFLDKNLFFFLGGKLKKVRTSIFVMESENKNHIIKPSVNVLWYLRYPDPIFNMVKLDLQKGSSNPLPKIRQEYTSKNDLSLLPLKKDIEKEYRQKKLIIDL